MGMGVVAIRDIPVRVSASRPSAFQPTPPPLIRSLAPFFFEQDETTLFSIPNSLLLSSSNSSLRPLIRQEDWDTLEETGGWASLMLCMMWEEFRGEESRWNGYFSECSDIVVIHPSLSHPTHLLTLIPLKPNPILPYSSSYTPSRIPPQHLPNPHVLDLRRNHPSTHRDGRDR
jgi:hypothetical protein